MYRLNKVMPLVLKWRGYREFCVKCILGTPGILNMPQVLDISRVPNIFLVLNLFWKQL